MARQKRSNLPPITEADLAHSRHRIRPTVNGWAWKCEYCGQFASSETVAGKYVCRSHGGVTPRQRDPVAYAVAKQNLKPVPRPPGRPPETGRWSKRDLLPVEQIVEDYKAGNLDPDDTDEDMLYLRALIDWQKQGMTTLRKMEDLLLRLQTQLAEEEGKAAPRTEEELRAMQRICVEINALVERRLMWSKRLAQGHEQVIKMAKVRADTRVKNSAERQIGIFMLMLRRMTTIFEEVLPPDLHYALQVRLNKEFQEVPRVISV